MTGTMTWVGLDVHARSTHAAAIDTMTGELSRVQFGPGIDEPIGWLQGLRGPVRACYEAGPTIELPNLPDLSEQIRLIGERVLPAL
jgi:hypothetical protein